MASKGQSGWGFWILWVLASGSGLMIGGYLGHQILPDVLGPGFGAFEEFVHGALFGVFSGLILVWQLRSAPIEAAGHQQSAAGATR